MVAERVGHQLVQRLQIPPMPNLPARAPGADTPCRCGELIKPQRTDSAWIYYCQSCGHDWSEPAPRRDEVHRQVRRVLRCKCDRKCRFCGGQR